MVMRERCTCKAGKLGLVRTCRGRASRGGCDLFEYENVGSDGFCMYGAWCTAGFESHRLPPINICKVAEKELLGDLDASFINCFALVAR